MKILFLDFDGVITTHKTRYKLDLEKIVYILEILKDTDAKIVVASSWKHGYKTVEEFKSYLKECDPCFIPKELKDNAYYDCFIHSIIGITETFGHSRGDEIKKYIDDNGVTQYCILDDNSDMLDEQLFNFIQTDYVYGISEREAELCIQVLNDIEVINPIRMNLELITRWRNNSSDIVYMQNDIKDKLSLYRSKFKK